MTQKNRKLENSVPQYLNLGRMCRRTGQIEQAVLHVTDTLALARCYRIQLCHAY